MRGVGLCVATSRSALATTAPCVEWPDPQPGCVPNGPILDRGASRAAPVENVPGAGSGVFDAVGLDGGVVEHGRTLGGRVALREALEGVEQDVVREGELVRREVALEHAPLRPEQLDARCEERRDPRGDLL